MLQVLYETDGRPQVFNLAKDEATIGRSNDNDIVLNDFSVSRRHAVLRRENDAWVIYDNQSTNGVRVKEKLVQSARLGDGDQAVVGTFVLKFREEVEAPPAAAAVRKHDSTSTCIRPIAEFNLDFGLEKGAESAVSESTRGKKRAVLDVAYKNKVFEILVQVAKTLISVDDVETVLGTVMDLIFEYLPVDRGFLLLEEDDGLKLRISRLKSSSRMTTDGAPYSRTIVDMVVRQKVAVLTSDAQTDERFEAGMSIRMQQIRSAMCAPLWSRDSVIGVIHVDSPMHVGSFTEKDLDLLTALANFAAVAIERARLRERFEEERRIRGRLERYHSPQVIDEIIAHVQTTGVHEVALTKSVTVLFADLVGFTTWSEHMAAGQMASLLTRFFTLASDAIFSQDGTIDKFIGDAVMAFFGAPIDQPDHAVRAVTASLKIQEEMAAWNRERVSNGEPPVAVRIALNTGEAIVGEIGSERRVDYTVLGNAVNVAARMEEFVAGPGDVVIGPGTYEAVKERFSVAQMGQFSLKGLSAQVPMYKVLGSLSDDETLYAARAAGPGKKRAT
jgi:adenylate cyclase